MSALTHFRVEEGILRDPASVLPGKVVIVTDEGVKTLYGIQLASQIGAPLLTVPCGERAKCAAVARRLLDALFSLKVGRETTLVAMGGGVTLDLVGYVASIYHRGIPLILIPTTLLAMVDASIGGKTAINSRYGKNTIGTYYLPQSVLIDPECLSTLPRKEHLNGLAEIWKLGLVYDALLWKSVSNPCSFDRISHEILHRAIMGKVQVTERDPTDRGVRRILNFGHTIGHALERIGQYAMAHGEAVAVGTVAEAHLSMQLGYLSVKEWDAIASLYTLLPVSLPKRYTMKKLWDAMIYDKKRGEGGIRFVMIDKIGHAVEFEGAYYRAVSPQELEATLTWLEDGPFA